MAKSPAYRWYPKDVLTSLRVMEMTLEEEGAYRRALDICWLNGSLPADPERLAKAIGKGASILVATVVLAMFETDEHDPSRIVHDRLEEERQKQREWSAKSAKGGKASAGKPKKPNKKNNEQGGVALVEPNIQPNGNIPIALPIAFSKEKKEEKEAASPLKPAPTKTVQFPIPRPDVDLGLWTEWLEMRRKLKKPLTQLGYDRLLKDLGSLIAFDLNDRLALAIDRKWQGLIFAEDKNGTNQPKSFQDQRAERAKEDYRIESEIRERVRQRDQELSRPALSDSSRQLSPFEPIADERGKGDASGSMGTGADGNCAGE